MTTATLYAKALRDIVQKDSSKAATVIGNLKSVLGRRGHQKLLPTILTEYEKLDLAEARSRSRQTVTPESERTRELLELYGRLVSSGQK